MGSPYALKIAKQPLLTFLLRHGLRYQNGSYWTMRHRRWLAEKLAERLLRALLPTDLPSALPEAERAAFNFTLELEELAAVTDRVAL